MRMRANKCIAYLGHQSLLRPTTHPPILQIAENAHRQLWSKAFQDPLLYPFFPLYKYFFVLGILILPLLQFFLVKVFERNSSLSLSENERKESKSGHTHGQP